MNSSHLEIINLVPKFVTFFKQSKNIIDMDEKWNLWENEYNFAAIPPTHEAHLRAKNDFINVYEDYFFIEKNLENFKSDEKMIYKCLSKLQNELNDYDPLNFQ